MGWGLSQVRWRAVDLAFGLAVPTALALLYYLPLLTRPGYLFYGDEIWWLYGNPSNVLTPFFAAWFNGQNGTALIGYQLVDSFALLFGNYAANHIVAVLLTLLPGASFYFTGIFFLNKTRGSVGGIHRLAVLVGCVFYTINWQNPSLVYPAYTLAMSYIVIPPLFALMILSFRTQKVIYCALFGAVSAVGSADPIWIVFLPIMAASYLVGRLVLSRQRLFDVKHLGFVAALLVGFAVLFNAYLLVPSLYGFLFHTGGVYSIYSNGPNQVLVARDVNWIHPIDALMFGQPNYVFFGSNQQNYTWLSIFLPVSAGLALICRAKAFTVYLLLNLVVALILVTGFNTPWGEAYAYIVMLSPPGIVGITRDVNLWFVMAAFFYACLLSLLAYETGSNLIRWARAWRTRIALARSSGPPNVSRSVRRVPFGKVGLLAVTGLVVVSVSMAATVQTTNNTLSSFTYPRFSAQYPPNDYMQVMGYLETHANSSKVMWLPSGATIDYPWKNNYPLSYEGLIFYPLSVTPDSILPYLANNVQTNLGDLLTASGVSYLVYDTSAPVPYNGQNFNASYVNSYLSMQSGIELRATFGSLEVYATLSEPQGALVGPPVFGPSWISPFTGVTSFSNHAIVYTNSSNLYEELAELSLLDLSYKDQQLDGRAFSVSVPQGQHGLVLFDPNVPTMYDYDPSLYHIANYTLGSRAGDFTLEYTIPAYLSDYAHLGNGSISANFGVLVQVYPSGQNPGWLPTSPYPSKRLASISDVTQNRFNCSSGEFSFTAPLIENADYYFSFYGQNSTPLSPLYYMFSNGVGNATGVAVSPLGRLSSTMGYEFLPAGGNNVPLQYIATAPSLDNGTINYPARMVVPTTILVGRISVSPEASSLLNSSNIYVQLQQAPNASSTLLFAGQDNYSLSSELAGTTMINGATPVPGNYTFRIHVLSGQAKYNGSIIQGSYQSLVPINGNFSAAITMSAQSRVVISLSLVRFNYTGAINVEEDSGTEYHGSYSSPYPAVILFPEQFSSGWVLQAGGRSYQATPAAMGSATAFLVPAGNYSFSITFSPETFQLVGFGLTAAAYAGLALFAIVPVALRKMRRNRG